MQHIEVERKFEIQPGATVPDLGSGLRLGEPSTHELTATYLDTPALDLVRAKVTLRRRTGGTDAGWHLKTPGDAGARVERHAPLDERPGTGRVPEELRSQVRSLIGSAPLAPVATLATVRRESEVIDESGRVVAHLCDDTVHAQPSGRTWRELEVELASDLDEGSGGELLEQVTRSLAEAGVAVSSSPSKLSQALGGLPEQVAARAELTSRSTAGEVVMAYCAAQVGVIQSREQDVRADAPDAVHKTRVATRRLRSALRTFRDLFQPGSTDALREELKWLGAELGGPRDAEVQKERLLAEVAALPAQLVVGPVASRVGEELDRRHDQARASLVAALDSDRCADLLDALADFVARPPVTSLAGKEARKVVPGMVADSVRRTDKVWKAAEASEGADRLVELHETRKKAKATRYACEAAEPAFGKDAKRLRTAYEDVTEALGHVQDAVVGVEQLRELSEAAAAAQESEFSYGALAARQLVAGAAAEAEGLHALEGTRARGMRSWTKD